MLTPRAKPESARVSGETAGGATGEFLLSLLAQAFDRRSWHGTNLGGSLRGLQAADAAWRPAADRHNAWELALHAAYWKYAVTRRLEGRKRGSFALPGSNFFPRPAPAEAAARGAALETAWRADLGLLRDCHRQLVAAVKAFPAPRWGARAPGSPFLFQELVSGVAAHDLYHAGQIQLLKRLRPGLERRKR